ncbi:DnaA/Hda family protein [Akkermansia muciniphila]|uniref:DnaA ATPase domain-containing protein n=1 Tax=Akkermansia muciniphila TaxID=239935 RepID=UPI0033B34998
MRSYKPVRYDMGGFDERVHPEVQAMHREVQWFINDVVNKVRPRRWLSLLGASGIGKTHLAEAARDALFKERPSLPIQFWKWQKVVSMLRSGDWAFVEYLVKEVYVLILDDIGAENTTPPILSALNRVVDGRLGKWTMLTSNLLPVHIGEHLDARIASRLYRGNNVVCQVENAPDYCFERYRRREGKE